MKLSKSFIKKISILLLLIIISTTTFSSADQKKKYSSWQEVASDMALCFDRAIEAVEADQYKQAYEEINDAYFGHYEVQGFEKNVMVAISRTRVDEIEAGFSNIKHSLLGNQEQAKDDILYQIELLKLKVYKDAMVLDGVAYVEDDDLVGAPVFEVKASKYLQLDAEKEVASEGGNQADQTDEQLQTESKSVKTVDPAHKKTSTFFTSFTLLLREGLEAILVLVAIIAYLVKTGNEHLKKKVYLGAFLGVVCSIILAVIIEIAFAGMGGQAQELIEAWTMFIAVAVLFYVSHWMLHKSSDIAWKKYIDSQVEKSVNSIDDRSKNALVFAAFIAVLREGAELILFYKAAFASGMSDTSSLAYGLLAGTVVLAIIFLAYRYFAVKIPLKPFFMLTSIMLFMMCISFMGKGVIELGEANVISGQALIPALEGFSIPLLNMNNRAEVLIPQLLLLFASLWLIISNYVSSKKISKEQQH